MKTIIMCASESPAALGQYAKSQPSRVIVQQSFFYFGTLFLYPNWYILVKNNLYYTFSGIIINFQSKIYPKGYKYVTFYYFYTLKGIEIWSYQDL